MKETKALLRNAVTSVLCKVSEWLQSGVSESGEVAMELDPLLTVRQCR